jgi:two-component system, OmpR family, phosphate regulon sensor histidine kinase PhoR
MVQHQERGCPMSTTTDAYRHRLSTLYWIERVISNPIKWALAISGTALLFYWNWDGIRWTEAATLFAYGLQNALFTVLFARASFSLSVAKLLVVLSYAFDFLFVSFLIFGLGGTASQIGFLMYVTLIFKAGLYYPVFKESLLVLPVAIALYVTLLGMREGADVFSEYAMKPRLFILLAMPLITIYTAHLFEQRERQVFQLNGRLRDRTTALRRKAQEMRAVIEGMHDGLLVIDAHHRVVTLNPVSSTILGLDADARTPISLAAVENGEQLREIVDEALRDSKATGMLEAPTPQSGVGDGSTRCFQVVASRIAGDNGNGDRVVMILRDITEQRQLENAKTNFLSIVSHELRTPLSSIKGFLKIILEGRPGPLNETQADFIATASGQAEVLNVLVNDLVEFTRMQVRQTDLDLSPVSLAEVATSICSRLKPLLDDKDLSLRNAVPTNLPEIEGDRTRLEQVVSNLLANAIKFTPAGGRITLSAWVDEDELTFAVSDTGIGIPADHLPKVFEPFYQVSDGPARLHGGMGLGLAICRHIIERHGGRLEVDSTEGMGSTFRFTLPAHDAPDQTVNMDLILRCIPGGRNAWVGDLNWRPPTAS